MIYTRLGAPVEITSARFGRIEGSECYQTETDTWVVTAKLTGPYPDGSGKAGDLLFDGGEVVDACEAIKKEAA